MKWFFYRKVKDGQRVKAKQTGELGVVAHVCHHNCCGVFINGGNRVLVDLDRGYADWFDHRELKALS